MTDQLSITILVILLLLVSFALLLISIKCRQLDKRYDALSIRYKDTASKNYTLDRENVSLRNTLRREQSALSELRNKIKRQKK